MSDVSGADGVRGTRGVSGADGARGADGGAVAVRRVPRPRADALRNRERLVTAAREMFVEFGPLVPYDEIARRAGVGNATLYRNFPERADLVHEVVLSLTARVAGLAERGAESVRAGGADAFDAVRDFVHGAADERVGALCPMLEAGFDHDHPDLVAERGRLEESVEDLLGLARAAGRLRPDVGAGDLLVGVSQLTRPLPGTGCAAFAPFVHRHLQLFLDGLEAPARSVLPGSAVTLEDLRRDA